MITPFPTLLEALERTLPTELVSPEALARIAAITRPLPACSGQLSLECRLRGGEPRVDFLFPVLAETGAHHALTAHLASRPPRREALADRLWRNTGALCAEWTRPGSLLQEELPFIWLEFDVTPATEAPAPFTYACVQPGFLKEQLLNDHSPERADLPRRLTLETLRLLRVEPLGPDAARCVQTCFEQLPDSASMMHVASLASRRMDALRLVMFMPCHELTGYLTRIGWPGSLAEVEALVERLAPISGFVDLDLDVGATVLSRIGMTLPQFWSPGTRRWRGLRELLAAPGVCAPEKLEALQRWLGHERVLLPGHRWPSLQVRNAAVKLVLSPGEPLEAKLYPNLEYQFSLFDQDWGTDRPFVEEGLAGDDLRTAPHDS